MLQRPLAERLLLADVWRAEADRLMDRAIATKSAAKKAVLSELAVEYQLRSSVLRGEAG